MSTYISHKKAKFDYEILKTFEAGLVLQGFEAKSIRNGKAQLEGSFVIVRGNEAFVTGLSISPYQTANTPKGYEPNQPRKLLLSKKELAEIERETENAGHTAVPLRLYDARGKIKVEVAIARGKKKVDKRETIKKRDTKRDIDRILKSQI